MRESKWQTFYFWVKYSLKTFLWFKGNSQAKVYKLISIITIVATGVTFFRLNTLIVFVLLAWKDEVNCAKRKEAPETLSADEPSAQGENPNLCRNFEEIKTVLFMNILSAPNEASALSHSAWQKTIRKTFVTQMFSMKNYCVSVIITVNRWQKFSLACLWMLILTAVKKTVHLSMNTEVIEM